MARRRPTVAAAEGIPEKLVLHDEHGAADPHVWFDVSLWSQAATAVRDALCQFDPPHAADYEKNAAAYQARLAKLHEYARTQLATIPKERRVLVTAHDAFQYFGRAYDIEVRGIQGISTESEAGVRQVNDLVDFLVERKIKAVFVESSVADAEHPLAARRVPPPRSTPSRSAASSFPTRWARPARPKERMRAWSGTTSTPS